MSSKFLELAKKSEKLLEEFKKTQTELEAEMISIGLEKYIQDPETSIVYCIVKPSGTFIYYKEIDYIRTKKEDERAGTLSVKKAQEAGFNI
jgi:hypothetical protein